MRPLLWGLVFITVLLLFNPGVDVTLLHTPALALMMGSLAVVGTSAANADEAQLAHRAGADYVGVGHVFMTTSKHKEGSPIGLETLADACRNTSRPVIAIGGINAENAAGVMQAGAHGIAVISAVCAADDPRAATARLREIVDANA